MVSAYNLCCGPHVQARGQVGHVWQVCHLLSLSVFMLGLPLVQYSRDHYSILVVPTVVVWYKHASIHVGCIVQGVRSYHVGSHLPKRDVPYLHLGVLIFPRGIDFHGYLVCPRRVTNSVQQGMFSREWATVGKQFNRCEDRVQRRASAQEHPLVG